MLLSLELIVWCVTPGAFPLRAQHTQPSFEQRHEIPNRSVQKSAANLGPKLGPLRPQSEILGWQRQQLNRTFGRGGGDGLGSEVYKELSLWQNRACRSPGTRFAFSFRYDYRFPVIFMRWQQTRPAVPALSPTIPLCRD